MNKDSSESTFPLVDRIIENPNMSFIPEAGSSKTSIDKTKKAKAPNSDCHPVLLKLAKYFEEQTPSEIDCEERALRTAENKVLRKSVIQLQSQNVQNKSSTEKQELKIRPQLRKIKRHVLPQVRESILRPHLHMSENMDPPTKQENILPQQEMTENQQEDILPQQEMTGNQQEDILHQQEMTENQQEDTLPQQEMTENQQEYILPQQEMTENQQEDILPHQEMTENQQEDILPQQEMTENQQEDILPQQEMTENQILPRIQESSLKPLSERCEDLGSQSVQDSKIQEEKKTEYFFALKLKKNSIQSQLKKIEDYYPISHKSVMHSQLQVSENNSLRRIQEPIIKPPLPSAINECLQKIQEPILQPKSRRREKSRPKTVGELLEENRQIPLKDPARICESIMQPDLHKKKTTGLLKQQKTITQPKFQTESLTQPLQIPKNVPVKMWESFIHLPTQMIGNQNLLKIQEVAVQQQLQTTENDSERKIIVESLARPKQITEHYSPRIGEPNLYLLLQTTENQNLLKIQEMIMQLQTTKSSSEQRIIVESLKQPKQIPEQNCPRIGESILHLPLQKTENQNLLKIQEMTVQQQLQTAENDSEQRIIVESLTRPQQISEYYFPGESGLHLPLQTPENPYLSELQQTFKQSQRQQGGNNDEPRTLEQSFIQPVQILENHPQRMQESFAFPPLQRAKNCGPPKIEINTQKKTQAAKNDTKSILREFILKKQKNKENNQSRIEKYNMHLSLQKTENQDFLKFQTAVNSSESRLIGESFIQSQQILENHPPRIQESISFPPLLMAENQGPLNIQTTFMQPKLQQAGNNREPYIIEEPLVHLQQIPENDPLSIQESIVYATVQNIENVVLPNIREIFMNLNRQTSENNSESRIFSELFRQAQQFREENDTPSIRESIVDPPLQRVENQGLPNIQEKFLQPNFSTSGNNSKRRIIEELFMQSQQKSENDPVRIQESVIRPPLQNTQNQSRSKIHETFMQPNFHTAVNSENHPRMRESVIRPPQNAENTHATLDMESNTQPSLRNIQYLQPQSSRSEEFDASMLSYALNDHNHELGNDMNHSDSCLDAMNRLEKWYKELQSVNDFIRQRYISLTEKLATWKHLMNFLNRIANDVNVKRHTYLDKINIDSNAMHEVNLHLDIECHCRKLIHTLKNEGKHFETAIALYDKYRMIYLNQSLRLICLPIEDELKKNPTRTLNAIDKLIFCFNDLSILLAEVDISSERRIIKCLEEFRKFRNLYVLNS